MTKDRNYKYEELENMFHTQVKNHKLDAARVPARDSSPKAILEFAKSLYDATYKDALHPSVLDKYKK